MWKQQVKQRMFLAFEETLDIFERTVAEYEEKLAGLRETERKCKDLEALLNPRIVLNRIDIQQTGPVKEEAPQDVKPVADQQISETVYENEDKLDLWSSVKMEQLDVKSETTTELSVKTEIEDQPEQHLDVKMEITTELSVGTEKEDQPQQHQVDSGDPSMLFA